MQYGLCQMLTDDELPPGSTTPNPGFCPLPNHDWLLSFGNERRVELTGCNVQTFFSLKLINNCGDVGNANLASYSTWKNTHFYQQGLNGCMDPCITDVGTVQYVDLQSNIEFNTWTTLQNMPIGSSCISPFYSLATVPANINTHGVYTICTTNICSGTVPLNFARPVHKYFDTPDPNFVNKLFANFPNESCPLIVPLPSSICDELPPRLRNPKLKDQLNNGIRIYPNPATNSLYIENIEAESTINLFDIYGRLIVKTIAKNSTFRLDLNSITPGIYFINCNGPSYKFIKQ